MINGTSFGDLAQSFILQRRGADLKAEMARLNTELVTGQVSDPKAVLAGNISYLADIENDLRLLDSYRVVTAEAQTFTDSMQNALDRIQTSSTSYSQDLLAVANNAVSPVLDQYAVDARAELETVVSALNTTVAGRTVFAGAATDRSAIGDVDAIIAAVQTAVTGATSIDDIFTAADAWFDDPAGFTATLYNGSDDSVLPFRVGDSETVDVPYTADETELREVVKGLALAALAGQGGLGFTADGQREFMTRVGTNLLTAQASLTALRADVGASQERIDQIASRNAAESLSLDYAKGALLGVDPYETATKLEEVQFQLQSLYTVTARMSDLTLVNFIR
ncbi:MAG: flagellin [Pseudomonadota bacterium]